MANKYPQNTYVGMRYVPLFDGDWDSSKDYEPLTVVNLDGNSYTSKTFVPAGVSPNGNLDYWAETGNYNAQIEAYRQEVLQYDGRITANADAIASLEAKEDADVALLKKKDPWSGIVICIGDSYLEGYTPSGTVTSWGQYIASKKKLASEKYVARYKGGVGFSATIDNINFLSLLKDAINGVDASEVSLIIIAGGYNDGSDDTSSEIINLVTYAKNSCINADVYVGYCGYGATTQTPYARAACYRYPQTCINAGGKNLGNLAEILKVNNSTAMDGYHPNATGQELLANSIINVIDGGEAYRYNKPYVPAIFSGDLKLNNCFLSIENGVFSLHTFSNNAINISVSGVLNNKKIATLTLDNADINIKGNLFMEYSIPCIVITTSGTYLNATAIIASSDTLNNIDIYVTCLNAGGTNYQSDLAGILFAPFSITAPLGLV